LREYLTGAGSDGGVQGDPALSLGGFRSATEAVSMGVLIANPVTGATILFAGGANPTGDGTSTVVDPNTLTWTPRGALGPGPTTNFPAGTTIKVVEAQGQPGQYLRIQGTPPFSGGPATISLSPDYNNFFGMSNVAYADALTGISEYRATIIRNESPAPVGNFRRWVAELAARQNGANSGWLPLSGAGTLLTSGSFVSWPDTGYCQVRDSGGVLKEVIYYSSRSNTLLNVPSWGRGLLGTTSSLGSLGDTLHSVPGIAIGMEPGGPQAFGAAIQTVANSLVPPSGVTWNLELDAAGGLAYGNLAVGKQVGFWLWRRTPGGTIATPSARNLLADSFTAF
jgi:hypothetical protein